MRPAHVTGSCEHGHVSKVCQTVAIFVHVAVKHDVLEEQLNRFHSIGRLACSTTMNNHGTNDVTRNVHSRTNLVVTSGKVFDA